jgi:MFS family permease
MMIPAATLTHLCLGSIFAWSIFNAPLMRLNGVVASSASDWALSEISVTFSLVMGGFAWGAIFGPLLDKYGPRVSCLIGAAGLSSGFLLASTAVQMQSLPLLYGSGLVWGISNGWAYVPSVSTLVKWFPDRKGFASGMCILGYGGGALVAAPLFTYFLEKFRQVPEYLGPVGALELINEKGRMFANTADGLRECVVATAADVQISGFGGLADAGVYAVGTGCTGIAETLAILGTGYGATMTAAAFAFRLPKEGFVPAGTVANEPLRKDAPPGQQAELTQHEVSASDSLRTPQFWMLFVGFGTSITGTYGLISCGKLMVSEIFSNALPTIVTAGFTSSFVVAMSAANLSGRMVWPLVSDQLALRWGGDPFWARKATFSGIWAISPLLYCAIPASVHYCIDTPGSSVPLFIFCGSVLGILNVFGGTTASRPAIIADLYGLKSLSTNAARQLSVVLPAAFAGPQIVAYFRKSSTESAIFDLAHQVEDRAFESAFGASKSSLPALVDSNAVTISRLLDILPDSVQDPTPFVYDNAMYALAAINVCAWASNQLLKPVEATLPTEKVEPVRQPKST